MSAAAAPLQVEIEARRAQIAKLQAELARIEAEISALTISLNIVTGSSQVQLQGARSTGVGTAHPPADTSQPSSTLGAEAASTLKAISEVFVGVASLAWSQDAEKVLADGKPHELKELADHAHRTAGRGAELEKVRKYLHVWISRKVEKNEVRRLERGWYQLEPKA